MPDIKVPFRDFRFTSVDFRLFCPRCCFFLDWHQVEGIAWLFRRCLMEVLMDGREYSTRWYCWVLGIAWFFVMEIGKSELVSVVISSCICEDLVNIKNLFYKAIGNR
ncbi:hypothetical protein AVEN_96323-1 [Araneus ventricosus]|uniref:Uncharacterized protein n=1 Tax=Araneus ventricosus TaxID=182803 RepID=A0A4Y2WI86_ARAVE|nr:hypothetical protein AVEN_96323-1 [Araneus ventricosus]